MSTQWSISSNGDLIISSTVTASNISGGYVTANNIQMFNWPDHLAPPDDGAAGVREPRRPITPLAPASMAREA
jgi:hypothetical protein